MRVRQSDGRILHDGVGSYGLDVSLHQLGDSHDSSAGESLTSKCQAAVEQCVKPV
jgi:hypothetical protein